MLRYLEKYAIRVGGGVNHRKGLYDAVMVKENHLAIARRRGVDYFKNQMKKLRAQTSAQIIIEIHKLDEIDEVICLEPDIMLFDNFRVKDLREAVTRTGKKVLTEASGSIDLDNVEEVAATGVDRISIGKLTHSYKSIDMSLEIH
jgi:nicotinate-nucleotide pyrophosphorylase (carboxylating)